MATYDSKENWVEIVSESLAARWLRGRSYQLRRPLAGIVRNSRPSSVFVENELLVDSADQDTIRQLSEQFDAEVIPPQPLPPQPEGMDPARQRSVEGMPETVTVRLEAERLPLDGLEQIAETGADGRLSITSRAGAGLMALTRRLLQEGRQVMPNLIGGATTMPLRTAQEGPKPDPNKNPFTWPEFKGSSRVVQAWQLIQAYEQGRSLHTPVYLGVFDAGFPLDDLGRMMAFGGNPPDVTSYLQWNLTDESRPAGGPNNEAGKEWHGTWVLGVAAAPLNNRAGVAGSGGVRTVSGAQIVVPVLFKTLRAASEAIRGLQLCVAWGVDVVNISWAIKNDSAFWLSLDPGFPSGLWERTFQFAADQGVVMIAAAGNDGAKLPDTVVLPATRTPGVITIGALNEEDLKDDNTRNRSWPSSNYGSSVNIWAPGNHIHVAPDPDDPNIGFNDGTSLAAPLVAGVAALMLAVNPSLRGSDIQRILNDTAYHDSPDTKVTSALNAQAALLSAMGGRLPETLNEEPNNTPGQARQLTAISPGVLGPRDPTLLSDARDEDWYFFTTKDFVTLEAALDFIPGLSWVSLALVPADPDSRADLEVTSASTTTQARLRVNQLAPGKYFLQVRGGGPNMYSLRVRLTPKPLTPDMFENNDSLENAAWFDMDTSSGGLFDAHFVRRFLPGDYEANLHTAEDVDYYHITNVSTLDLLITTFQISLSDAPVEIALLSPDGTVLERVRKERNPGLRLRGPECWVRVSGKQAARYHLRLFTKLDKRAELGPLQEVDVSPVPHWLPDPPEALDDFERFYQVQIDQELLEIGKLRLTGDPGLTLHLIDGSGQAIAAAQPAQAGESHVQEIDLAGLQPGAYVARVGRAIGAEARFAPGLGKKLASFQLGPGW